MREVRYLASKAIFNASPLAKIITELMNVTLFGCFSLFTGEMISYCSNMSSELLNLSCK